MKTIPSQRHLFEIPEEIAYFNCAYYSPQLKESTHRLLAGAREKNSPWQRIPADFFDDAETIRSLASNLFGGDRDGYAIVPAVSYAISAAARAVEPGLRAGDRILLIAEEFPSSVLPWRRTAQESGARIVTVPAPDDGDWTRPILDRIDERVRVVSISTCHWTNAALIDVLAISKACRDAGRILVIDATQTLGAMPLSLAEVSPDFLVAAGYKWLLGPYGFGLMYVSERWRNARPLEETWITRDNAEDFTSLANYSDVYRPGARRFDVGETCTPTILPGAIAALKQIASWGIDNIAASLREINSTIAAHLEGLNFQLPPESQRCPHMLGAVLPKGQTLDLVGALRKQQIYISQRANSLRFAPHLYITGNDIDRLLSGLDHLMR